MEKIERKRTDIEQRFVTKSHILLFAAQRLSF